MSFFWPQSTLSLCLSLPPSLSLSLSLSVLSLPPPSLPPDVPDPPRAPPLSSFRPLQFPAGQSGQFVAKFKKGGVPVHLGTFSNAVEAAVAIAAKWVELKK